MFLCSLSYIKILCVPHEGLKLPTPSAIQR